MSRHCARRSTPTCCRATSGVTYLDEGPARLVPGGVEVGGRRITAPKVIVATGGRPAVPDIPGVQDAPTLDSTSLLELDRLPESLIFLGGGYIGVELAQMMARMGTRVTIVCRSRLLPRTEPEVAAGAHRGSCAPKVLPSSMARPTTPRGATGAVRC